MYIARFSEKEGSCQSVKNHLEDVSYFSGKFAGAYKMTATLELAGLIHDMGKYSDEFQSYITCQMTKSISEKGPKVDHGKYGAKYIWNEFHHGNMVEKLTAEIITVICAYHHGGLPDCVDHNGGEYSITIEHRVNTVSAKEMDTVVSRFDEEIGLERINKLFKSACEETASIVSEIESKMDRPGFGVGLLVKLVYSSLIDADRYDSYLYEIGVDDVKKFTRTSNVESMIEKYLKSYSTYMKELSKIVPKSDEMKKVKDIREKVLKECISAGSDKRNLFTLTVPTGGGKTLSSLGFALQQCKKFSKKRIIYVMPFTTIVEQNAAVARAALGPDVDLLEHHSNVVEDNETDDYKLLTQRWNSDVIFTTMVQFLNSFYNSGTQDYRRIHDLVDSVIIFDEIQAVPLKCIGLFNEVINFLTNICNATIVLCSATQPTLEKTKIPMQGLSMDSEIISDPDSMFDILKRVELVDDTGVAISEYDSCANYILDTKRGYNSLLFVANRIKTVKELYKILSAQVENGIKVFALTTNMCPAHRRRILTEIIDTLNQGEQVICLSTALIEAGVDISFEVGIRCIAGYDSIIQTSGRINRNGEMKIGYCHVIAPGFEKLENTPEIMNGATHSVGVLNQFHERENKLAPDIIRQYFLYYYSDHNAIEKLKYPIGKNSDIYTMLTCAMINTDDYYKRTGKAFDIMLLFKFKTASEEFNVIDDNTVSVLVPYGEGEEIITKMSNYNSYIGVQDKIDLLKRANPFFINVYDSKRANLINDKLIEFNESYGVWILKDSFYSENIGLDENGGNMEFLGI